VRLTPGTRVGPYEVVSLLGAGGMAEVYRAKDTRLGREVAVKVVSEALGTDPAVVQRFEREAKLAGSLNHANVVALYDVGFHDGNPYFVTELLQGESLRERLARGPLPLGTALEWAVQMAQGLAAAHERGIAHRDLKPENVFLTKDGPVKVIDFGIAKLVAAAREAAPHGLMDETASPSGSNTGTGLVLGTPAYMSPEQVRGDAVDARTDLFSFGAVLYEMLAGRRAFQGTNPVESGYAILHTDPEPLPADVPQPVVQLVQRSLQKDPARRFHSASDLAFALEMLRSPFGITGPPLVEPRPKPRRIRWILGAVGLGTAALAALFAAENRPQTPVAQAAQGDFKRVTTRWGQVTAARFLPDGRVAFSAAFEGRPQEMFVQPLRSPNAQSLGLEDASLLAASLSGELALLVHPQISLGSTPEGTLARVPSVGGIPREVAENVQYADWSPADELAVVRRTGASSVLEFPPGKTVFRTNGWISHPRFSPQGDRIAFLHHPIIDDNLGEVMVTDLQGQARTLSKRFPTVLGLAWSPVGNEIWFTSDDTLMTTTLEGTSRDLYRSLSTIDLQDVARDGRVLITSGVNRSEVVYRNEASGTETLLSWAEGNDPLAALTPKGKLLFTGPQAAPVSEGLATYRVLLRGKDGAPAQVLGDGYALDLSLDGRWALVGSEDGKTLTAVPTGAGEPQSIPTGGLEFLWHSARWAPDGKTVFVVARSLGDDAFRLYRLRSDASSPARLGEAAFSPQAFLQVSPDGRWAAALDQEFRTVVISLDDGATRPLPYQGGDLVIPRGWTPSGDLWITEGGRTLRARTPLLRVNARSGETLERRSIGPADPSGASALIEVVLSPEGSEVAFTYGRFLNNLYLAQGLGR
jgi:eukaryotic-like serine/threonine-protein kinase